MTIQPFTPSAQRKNLEGVGAGLLILLVVAVVLFTIGLQGTRRPDALFGARYASFVGITVLAILYVLYRLFAGTWKLSTLYRGADQRPSTSKFQALVWTIVAIFAYSGIYALRASTGSFEAVADIPTNLMLAMGFTFTTLVAAKGITVSYVNSGQVAKPAPAPGEPTSVAREDGGDVDLTKVQMLAWTYIAAGVYLFHLIHFFNTYTSSAKEQFPDIDAALMVLMGLSHGVYVGKKLVTTDTPALSLVGPKSGPPGTAIVITGAAFGATQGPSILTLDGAPIAATKWSDTQIDLAIPSTHPTKGKWGARQPIVINVIVNGQSGVVPLQFTVVPPAITSVTPDPGKANQNVTIIGEGFGMLSLAPRTVTVGGTAATIVSWSDEQIVVTVPAAAKGAATVIVTAGTESTAPFAFNAV